MEKMSTREKALVLITSISIITVGVIGFKYVKTREKLFIALDDLDYIAMESDCLLMRD